MNKLLATLLATAIGATIAAAPAAAQTGNTAAYDKAMQKVEADHKTAKQKCDALKDEDVCEEQADVMRARAELAAVKKHSNTADNRDAAQRKLAEAEYELAEEKCDAMKGNTKDSCMTTAKSARTAALAKTKGGAETGTSNTSNTSGAGKTATAAAGVSGGLVATTDTKDPVKAAAVDKCDTQGGKIACLVENKDGKSAAGATAAAGSTAAARTENAAERAGEKTKGAVSTMVDKTKQAARSVGEKTGLVKADHAGDHVGATTTAALSDTAITTKVKAGLAAEPDLSALAIKVETEKGVVMLSGFVDSKAAAGKAEKLAKGVEGVTRVKSTITVK